MNKGAVVLFDPSVDSANMGDEIIAEAVRDRLAGIECSIQSLATQRPLNGRERGLLKGCALGVVGGTNLLSSNMPFYRQWRVGVRSAVGMRHKAILLGVGWWQYQSPPNTYTRTFLRHVLRPGSVHSVRDEYSRRQLLSVGVNAINTGCPTIWGLQDSDVPVAPKSSVCVTTVTDYNKAPSLDKMMISKLKENYDRVVAWPQSVRDLAYLQRLGVGVEVLRPTLQAFDELLRDVRPDYIGTRLHGGIRAMRAGSFARIVAVDNRATEMGRDFGLPVIERCQVVDDFRLLGPRENRIFVPNAPVKSWLDSLNSELQQLA